MARLAASVLTLTSISFFVLALWRVGMDLNFAGAFVFTSGFLSHWQVWMAAAAATQYLCFRLTRYARSAQEDFDNADVGVDLDRTVPVKVSVANV